MADPDVLVVLDSWEPTAPRLTWYGRQDERIELSGRVLTNWVIKAANLLSTECAVDAGSTVLLDLPPHWRLLVWDLACRVLETERVGAPVGAELPAADVVVTSRPQDWHAAGLEVIAVPLPALARSWPGALPAGAIDGAAELMAQPDLPVFAVSRSRAASTAAAGARRLLVARDAATLIEEAWACWRDGGSVVVVDPDTDADLGRIAAQEGTTGV